VRFHESWPSRCETATQSAISYRTTVELALHDSKMLHLASSAWEYCVRLTTFAFTTVKAPFSRCVLYHSAGKLTSDLVKELASEETSRRFVATLAWARDRFDSLCWKNRSDCLKMLRRLCFTDWSELQRIIHHLKSGLIHL
jgi:hypothetical protein